MSDPTQAGGVHRVPGRVPGADLRPDTTVPSPPRGGESVLASRAAGAADPAAARDAASLIQGLLASGAASEVFFDLAGGGDAESPSQDIDVTGLLGGLAEAMEGSEAQGAAPARKAERTSLAAEMSPYPQARFTREGMMSLIAVGGMLAGCAVGAFALGPAGLLMTFAVELLAFTGGVLVSQAENKKLEHAATHDPLTGLKNRGAIMRILDEAVVQFGGRRRHLAVVLADVDHFKRINDTWGHPAGDAVLIEVARRVAAAVRLEDAVGRYGGEELLIVLPGLAAAEAVRAAERIRLDLASRPVETAEGSIQVTASFGVASSSEVDAPPTAIDLIKRADEALYRAKGGGRNRVEAAWR